MTWPLSLRSLGVTAWYIDEVFDTEPDITAIPNRDLWILSRHLDSRRLTIQMEKHGDKIALLEYDRLVTFWKQNGGDLTAICRGALGQNMTDYQQGVVAA